MQLYNGSPVPIKARAEGFIYVFDPGEVKEIQEEHRARTMLDNFGRVGLKAVKFGDNLEEIKVECDALFYGHLEETLKNYKEYQLDQAQQGLKPFRRIPQTEDFAKMLERRTGESVDLGKYAGDDPTLALIQQLGRAMKADDVDPEQAARIQDIIKDLSKKRVSKPDGPAPKPNTVGIANQRRAQKARQQKSGKGKGKGKGKAAETSEAPAGEAEGTTEE